MTERLKATCPFNAPSSFSTAITSDRERVVQQVRTVTDEDRQDTILAGCGLGPRTPLAVGETQ